MHSELLPQISLIQANMGLQIEDDDTQEIVAPIITQEMEEEEAKLAKANEAKLEKERLKKEAELNDEILREQSKKRLVTLLKKSKFYASYMKKRLEDNIKKEEKKNKGRNPAAPPNKKRKIQQKYTQEIADSITSNENGEESANAEDFETNACIQKEIVTRLTPMGVEVNEEQPILLEGACMRDYQLAGFNWLKSLFETGMNGILADEMGLGKTIQTISLISHLYANGVLGPFLIVAPLSTLPNWINEFEIFAPKIPVILYHASEEKRRKMARNLLKTSRLLGKTVQPVIITSYEVPLRDEHILGKITWKYLVVDEGHRIKNHNTKLSRVLGGFRSINRLLLTGTPLQNNLAELWALLHFLLPEVFDSLDVFETLFTAEELAQGEAEQCLEKEKKSNILTLLHEILKPFLLRRLKSDVNLDLPQKKEILVKCPMTKMQFDLYKAVLEKSIMVQGKFCKDTAIIPDREDGTKYKRFTKSRDPSECYEVFDHDWDLVEFGEGVRAIKLRLKMTMPHMVLIKILNHPFLVADSLMQVEEEIIQSSGKMVILDGLLERLKARGHKVLIFSTYTSLLNVLQDYMELRDYSYRRLDGNTNIDDRRTYMREFNTDPDIFTFLLSTRAGGLGINLTGADTVIIFNSDWNPQADLQAQDRCHRIGQKKPVLIYRFMVPTTMDERIVNRASCKRKLEKMVIQKGMFKTGPSMVNELTLEELRELLNEKQHNLEVHPNGTTLTNEEWETLLDRSGLE
ncbi:hypothetical protein GE061_014507 [Apolygus lucorum]|uniref:Lymphoid-specific helicase n=1 Tax=Apolygus lucorum TaxID=248454 RepID=A0A8S9XIG5_APOLU|nr:hypothetical protein GE061_014507 [Apolygus lucorum]